MRLFIITVLLLSSFLYVACGKKKETGNNIEKGKNKNNIVEEVKTDVKNIEFSRRFKEQVTEKFAVVVEANCAQLISKGDSQTIRLYPKPYRQGCSTELVSEKIIIDLPVTGIVRHNPITKESIKHISHSGSNQTQMPIGELKEKSASQIEIEYLCTGPYYNYSLCRMFTTYIPNQNVVEHYPWGIELRNPVTTKDILGNWVSTKKDTFGNWVPTKDANIRLSISESSGQVAYLYYENDVKLDGGQITLYPNPSQTRDQTILFTSSGSARSKDLRPVRFVHVNTVTSDNSGNIALRDRNNEVEFFTRITTVAPGKMIPVNPGNSGTKTDNPKQQGNTGANSNATENAEKKSESKGRTISPSLLNPPAIDSKDKDIDSKNKKEEESTSSSKQSASNDEKAQYLMNKATEGIQHLYNWWQATPKKKTDE